MKNKPDPRLDDAGKPLPTAACPNCGYKTDAATLCDEAAPKDSRPCPADITVCLRCATVLQFTEDMMLQPFDIDAGGVDDDTRFQVRRIQQNIRQIKWDK